MCISYLNSFCKNFISARYLTRPGMTLQNEYLFTREYLVHSAIVLGLNLIFSIHLPSSA